MKLNIINVTSYIIDPLDFNHSKDYDFRIICTPDEPTDKFDVISSLKERHLFYTLLFLPTQLLSCSSLFTLLS